MSKNESVAAEDAVASPEWRPPRTWLMMGHKAGDNSQILALAEALGWPFEIKRLAYRKTEILTNLFAGPTLKGLIQSRSDRLEPPWPELIISAGRRNEPLVRWIQREAGGPDKVKLVHAGRPWALHECFDLIVTTPQYRLPEKPNILQNEAPLHRVTKARLDAAAARLAPALADLPRPFISVIIGGNAGPYVLDRENGALLGYHASKLAESMGGSLLVTTSARTPAKAIDAFMSEIRVPAFVYRWRKDDPDNPYFGILAMADRHIVTADSMSMMVEACVTRKPVLLFDFSRGPGNHRPPLPTDHRLQGSSWLERLQDWKLQPYSFRFGLRYAPTRLTRDVTLIHKRQVEIGRCVWLGEPWPDDRPLPPPMADVERAADRVRALFDPANRTTTRRVPKGPPLMPAFLRRFFQ
ncbi:fission protein ELM1 [Arboricoccus pini]|uniref:Fission protein ELM1 n=1 Tax=Arboricoccus pini TaxID=1963835 RepID=A0A212R298_9PROT|nr:ELM1/GtrOC1 family putative glycosyltransferase [Arboricoccus pini]SNB66110.1 fission protein ELM1 [Arboricoccus pini]